MNKFKYGFKKYMYLLMAVAIVVSCLCIAINVYRFISAGGKTNSGYFGFILTILVCLLIIVLVVSIMVSSYYEVTDKNFILKWGLLKNEIAIKDITKTEYNEDTKKLAVFYGEQDNFMVLQLNQINPLDIVDALREVKKDILFESFSSASIEPNDKNNKK